VGVLNVFRDSRRRPVSARVTIHEPDPLAEFQDERAVYHDDIQDYSTNEPTMDGTASAILMWAVMNAD
jgi:endoglucanase